MTEALFAVRGLSVRFGRLSAVDGVSIFVADGAIHCIIGPNGAGKSTLLNAVSGFARPASGTAHFAGADITRLGVPAIRRLGVSRTFQRPRIFGPLSVREHLLVARPGRAVQDVADKRLVDELVVRLGLERALGSRADALSHGERRHLELAMALAWRPRLLLLDEPTAGLTEDETSQYALIVKEVRRTWALTVIVVEHDMAFVRDIADVITVMHRGRVLTEGGLAEVQADPAVQEVYLGNTDELAIA